MIWNQAVAVQCKVRSRDYLNQLSKTTKSVSQSIRVFQPTFERVPSEFKVETLPLEQNLFGFIAQMSLGSKFKIEFNVLVAILRISLASKKTVFPMKHLHVFYVYINQHRPGQCIRQYSVQFHKVKLPAHAMKAYIGLEVQLQSFLVSAIHVSNQLYALGHSIYLGKRHQ